VFVLKFFKKTPWRFPVDIKTTKWLWRWTSRSSKERKRDINV